MTNKYNSLQTKTTKNNQIMFDCVRKCFSNKKSSKIIFCIEKASIKERTCIGHVRSNNKFSQFRDGDGQSSLKISSLPFRNRRSMIGRVQLMKGGRVIPILISDKLTIELKIDRYKEMLRSQKGVQMVEIRLD